ncbi:hypothetical protein ACLB2K_024862 [Fragaria x ananassa]
MSMILIPHYSTPSICYSFPNKTLISSAQNRSTRATHNNDQNHQVSVLKFDRRNVLLGLGGLTLVNHPNLARAAESKKLVRLAEFPTALDSVISVMVPRPRRSRSKKEKEEEEEVLSIEGIEFVADKAVKFDVHVNDDEDDLSRPSESQFAGSLVFLPQSRKRVRTSLHLGITDLLEDLGADGESSIKVTLVPRYVQRPITIGRIKIDELGSKMSETPPALGESEAYAAAESTSKKVVEITEFPITLDSVISVTVPRPKKCRTKEEKEEEEEVLAIQGIEFVADELVKFDVHVNDDEDDLSRPDNSEFAGSFVYLPHRRKTVTTSLRLGITDLLDDLGADGDDSIKVTLVPKCVKRPVTIGKLKIEFLK